MKNEAKTMITFDVNLISFFLGEDMDDNIYPKHENCLEILAKGSKTKNTT